MIINPLSAKPTKWLNTLKQFVGNLPTNCLSLFDHFVGLALKGLNKGWVKRSFEKNSVFVRTANKNGQNSQEYCGVANKCFSGILCKYQMKLKDYLKFM